MNVLGRWVSSCRGFYQELNSANLTGAIDVLVVQQPDGRLQSTPFHVRFGKLGVLRPGDQMKVEVKVNGNVMPFYMTLDESGSAFFVEQEAATPTPQGEARLLGGMVGGARSMSALEDDESTPTNSPCFESKSLPSVDGWSHGNTHVPIATRQSDPALLHEDPLEEDIGSTLRSKSVPSVTHAPVAQSSYSMLPSKQDGGMEKDDDACLFELSDTEGSVNNGGATDLGGVANANESVGGRPTNEELETIPSALSQSLPNSYLSDSDSYPPKVSRMIREDPSSVHSDTELEMGPSSRTTLSSLKLSGEPIGSSAPLPAPAKSDGFLRTMMRLFGRGQGQSQSYMEEGLFLDDLETVFMPPEERSQYFPAPHSTSLDHTRSARGTTSEDEGDSGVSEERSPARRDVVSAPCSPSKGNSRPTDLFSRYGDDETDPDSLVANFEGLQLSLCGGLKDGASDISDETFAKRAVTFEQFANKPSLLSHPDLVVKIKGHYYNWQVAAPLLMSILVFHKPLPQTEVDKLVSSHMRKEERASWSWWRWGRRSSSIPAKMNEFRDKPSNPSPPLHEHAISMSSDEGEEPEEREAEQRRPYRHKSTKRKRRKSRYLTEEQLECLNLQLGVNEAEFSVTTMIQGTCTTMCSIYLWKSTDKIIVSDIDGTITRSDVAGHLLPMLGKDWSHAGVVALFNSVADNGYKFVYLSARPIGYSQLTRNYLQGVRQGNGSLPSGPMFLAPLSVLKAFTKEVIEKKPEEFKIACLEEIRKLFPPDRNPFYAGFGNKTTDETSYKAVGIPTTQMYTINTRGELKNTYLTSFKSSYKSLKEYIDHMFPPLDAADQIDGGGAGDEFSYLNFWRTPFSPETFQLPEDVV